MQQQSNPFIVALAVIGVCAGLLALILASVANNEAGSYIGDPAIALAASVWAGLFAQVAIFAILGALVSAAVRWNPTDRGPANPLPPVDTSGMTDGERKFFTDEDGR